MNRIWVISVVIILAACGGRSLPGSGDELGSSSPPEPLPTPWWPDAGPHPSFDGMVPTTLSGFCQGPSKIRGTLFDSANPTISGNPIITNVSFDGKGPGNTHQMEFNCQTSNGTEMSLTIHKLLPPPPPGLSPPPVPATWDLALMDYTFDLQFSGTASASGWAVAIKLKPSQTHDVMGTLDFSGNKAVLCLGAVSRTTGEMDLMLYLRGK